METKINLDLSKDKLTDPTIDHKTVALILLEGDLEKVTILCENPRFLNWNHDLLIAASKIKIKWSHNPYYQIAISFVILSIDMFLNLLNKYISLSILSFILYIFFIKLPKFSSQKEEDEKLRIEYIFKMLKDSPYDLENWDETKLFLINANIDVNAE